MTKIKMILKYIVRFKIISIRHKILLKLLMILKLSMILKLLMVKNRIKFKMNKV